MPFRDLKIELRGVGEVKRVVSTASHKDLDIERTGDGVSVVLPLLEEGDILRIEQGWPKCPR